MDLTPNQEVEILDALYADYAHVTVEATSFETARKELEKFVSINDGNPQEIYVNAVVTSDQRYFLMGYFFSPKFMKHQYSDNCLDCMSDLADAVFSVKGEVVPNASSELGSQYAHYMNVLSDPSEQWQLKVCPECGREHVLSLQVKASYKLLDRRDGY